MTIAIYAGSFDPITNGHIDILKSAAQIFDKVIIAVAYNYEKRGFLPIETRIDLIKQSVIGISNVEVDSFEGLTVDYARKYNANVLLRGLRNSSDFEYEMQLAYTNLTLNKDIQTIFLPANPKSSYISSSAVREILQNHGDISTFVPKAVCDYFKNQR